jgi:hypothetical protein
VKSYGLTPLTQSKSNPQHPWAYPDAALAEFRKWMRETYLVEKFPHYLQSQEKNRALPPSISSLVLAAVSRHALPPPGEETADPF